MSANYRRVRQGDAPTIPAALHETKRQNFTKLENNTGVHVYLNYEYKYIVRGHSNHNGKKTER